MENNRENLNELIDNFVNQENLHFANGSSFKACSEEAEQKLDEKLKSIRKDLIQCHYAVATTVSRGELDLKKLTEVKNMLSDVILDMLED